MDDEVLLYGELMTALRRGGGSLRAEAILEQLLQELGATRAALSSERGEGRTMRARLETLEEQHSGCADSKKMLQVRPWLGLGFAGEGGLRGEGRATQARLAAL